MLFLLFPGTVPQSRRSRVEATAGGGLVPLWGMVVVMMVIVVVVVVLPSCITHRCRFKRSSEEGLPSGKTSDAY